MVKTDLLDTLCGGYESGAANHHEVFWSPSVGLTFKTSQTWNRSATAVRKRCEIPTVSFSASKFETLYGTILNLVWFEINTRNRQYALRYKDIRWLIDSNTLWRTDLFGPWFFSPSFLFQWPRHKKCCKRRCKRHKGDQIILQAKGSQAGNYQRKCQSNPNIGKNPYEQYQSSHSPRSVGVLPS